MHSLIERSINRLFVFGCFEAETMRQGLRAGDYQVFIAQHDALTSMSYPGKCIEFIPSKVRPEMRWSVKFVQDELVSSEIFD
jgi:hypothetical protein